MSDVQVDGIYRDSDGNEYTVLAVGKDTETEQVCVLYKPLLNVRQCYVSSLSRFQENFTIYRPAGAEELVATLDSYRSMPYEEGVFLGCTYRHFKGKVYRALYVAKDANTQELYVAYKAVYEVEDDVWVRPLQMFLGKAEHEGKSVDRFTLIT